jgi:tyrosine-protein kinase Etk/Wzc
MEETDKIKQKLPHQEFDYFKIGKILLSRWYWITAAVILCVILGNIYLWYTPKIFMTQATMKLEDTKPEISDLAGAINNSDKGPSKVQSETFVIQSRSLILNAIKTLNYPISFYLEGRVRTRELYPQKPLDIKLIQLDSLNFYQGIIKFTPVDETTFNLTYQLNGQAVTKNFLYNNPVNISSTTFIIKYSKGLETSPAYLFNFNNPDGLVGRVRGGLRTSEVIKNSNIISLQQTDSNPQFAADILNAIMTEYVDYDRNQKQQSASQIILFIDKQLDTISEKVRQSESAIEDYKKNSKILDVNSSGQTQLARENDIETQQNILKIQLNSLEEFKQQIAKEKDNVNLNFNVDGTVDQSISLLISSLNTLLADKTSLLSR